MKPQCKTILAHVQRVGHISGRAALLDYSIAALPRRIKDLENLGYRFRREDAVNAGTGQRYRRYFYEGRGDS